MWWFEARLFNPQVVMAAQVVVEALLVVLVALLLWRQPRSSRPEASERMMAATENLLRRLEEKRRALETAMDKVSLKRGPAPAAHPGREELPGKRTPLERASVLAARGLSSAEIARELGVPRAEVEMYLSLREGLGRQA